MTKAQITALPLEQKESYKWLRSAERTSNALKDYLDDGGQVVLVGDRESDLTELFAQERHPNFHLLVRAMHPRRVEAGSQKLSLPALLDSETECGEYSVTVSRQHASPEREAKMGLKYAQVTLAPAAKKVAGLQLWVVQAMEKDAPTGVTPLSWTLFSTKEVSDFDEARRVVQRYSRRWLIERLHYTLKTGCFNVERLQFDDLHTLANALAFYYVVAWQVLWLMYWSREKPEAPVGDFFSKEEVLILESVMNSFCDL